MIFSRAYQGGRGKEGEEGERRRRVRETSHDGWRRAKQREEETGTGYNNF